MYDDSLDLKMIDVFADSELEACMLTAKSFIEDFNVDVDDFKDLDDFLDFIEELGARINFMEVEISKDVKDCTFADYDRSMDDEDYAFADYDCEYGLFGDE